MKVGRERSVSVILDTTGHKMLPFFRYDSEPTIRSKPFRSFWETVLTHRAAFVLARSLYHLGYGE